MGGQGRLGCRGAHRSRRSRARRGRGRGAGQRVEREIAGRRGAGRTQPAAAADGRAARSPRRRRGRDAVCARPRWAGGAGAVRTGARRERREPVPGGGAAGAPAAQWRRGDARGGLGPGGGGAVGAADDRARGGTGAGRARHGCPARAAAGRGRGPHLRCRDAGPGAHPRRRAGVAGAGRRGAGERGRAARLELPARPRARGGTGGYRTGRGGGAAPGGGGRL